MSSVTTSSVTTSSIPLSHRTPVTLLSLAVAGVLASTVAGCAAQPPPRMVRMAELGTLGPLLPGQALILELEAGDTIPLRFTLEGPLVKSPDGAPLIPLEVVRHFFLRIDEHGLKSSLDGKNFDWKSTAPGQFQVGVGVTKEGPMANITIRTPTPPGLTQ